MQAALIKSFILNKAFEIFSHFQVKSVVNWKFGKRLNYQEMCENNAMNVS